VKEEIYKKSFERYITTKYKDNTKILPIDEHGADLYFNASEKHPLFQKEESFEGEEYYLKHLKDPMYSVQKEYVMIVVEKNEDKVSIKFFNGFMIRQGGKPWFKVEKHLDYISVNLKTGDVYNGSLRRFNKKTKCIKSIRRNCFYLEPLNSLKSKLKNYLTIFTDTAFNEVSTAFSEFLFQIDQRKNFESLNYEDRLFRFYLDKRGIKYPNNFKVYTGELRGREMKKILTKNDNKLVESVMIKNNLSGKKIRHALHFCNSLNLTLYEVARKMFGDNWLNQDKESVILDLLNQPSSCVNIPTQFIELVSKEELRKVYILFKQVFIHQNLDSMTFSDHMRMYTELKSFGEHDLKWKSVESKSDFREEHLDWTEKLQHYKMGNYTRHYPEYMYEMISQPLYENYHPVLLNTSSKYNEESSWQSNCVKGYIGKAGCLIVSVRGGGLLEERATIEYRLTMKDELVHADRVQSLGKFNQRLEAHWDTVLLKLDKQVLSCVRDERFETVKLTKECKNGTILNSDTYWDEEGTLRWTFKNIDSTQSNYLFFNQF
jgi:hypothetical protein